MLTFFLDVTALKAAVARCCTSTMGGARRTGEHRWEKYLVYRRETGQAFECTSPSSREQPKEVKLGAIFPKLYLTQRFFFLFRTPRRGFVLRNAPVCSTISGTLRTHSSNQALPWKDNHHPKACLGLKLVIIIPANCLFNEPFVLALEQFLCNPAFDICNSWVCEVCKQIWSGNCTYSLYSLLGTRLSKVSDSS